MAITQDSMSEEVLSKSERAIVRAVYKATRIREALIALEQMEFNVFAGPQRSGILNEAKENLAAAKQYLTTRMAIAILSAKVPKANLVIPKDSDPQDS